MLNSLFIGSTSIGKINEFKFILNSLSENICLTYLEKDSIVEPDEPYDSFLENALHKAKYYASYSNLPTLCDDSGLCIEALDGFPGVKTKNFVQECGSFENAFKYLEKTLQNKSKIAYFRIAVALYIPKENKIFAYEADTFGSLQFPAKGDYGFGFHSVFVPDGYSQTMSELGTKVITQCISSRVIATKKLVEQLKNNKTN